MITDVEKIPLHFGGVGFLFAGLLKMTFTVFFKSDVDRFLDHRKNQAANGRASFSPDELTISPHVHDVSCYNDRVAHYRRADYTTQCGIIHQWRQGEPRELQAPEPRHPSKGLWRRLRSPANKPRRAPSKRQPSVRKEYHVGQDNKRG